MAVSVFGEPAAHGLMPIELRGLPWLGALTMLNVSWQDSTSLAGERHADRRSWPVAAVTGDAVGAVFCGAVHWHRRRATSWPMFALLLGGGGHATAGGAGRRAQLIGQGGGELLPGPFWIDDLASLGHAAGDARLVLPVMPKKATSWALALVVVTDGAVILTAAALVWPLWSMIGLAVSTPL